MSKQNSGQIKTVITTGWGRLNLIAGIITSIFVGVFLESKGYDYYSPYGENYNGYTVSYPQAGEMLTIGIVVTLIIWIIATLLFMWVVKGASINKTEFRMRSLVLSSIIVSAVFGYFYCIWMEDGPVLALFLMGFVICQIAFWGLAGIINWVLIGFRKEAP